MLLIGVHLRFRRLDSPMRAFREIFGDRLMLAALIIFLLIIGLFIFNSLSSLALAHPLFGVFNYSLVPILFIAGGIVFVLAVLREIR